MSVASGESVGLGATRCERDSNIALLHNGKGLSGVQWNAHSLGWGHWHSTSFVITEPLYTLLLETAPQGKAYYYQDGTAEATSKWARGNFFKLQN